MQKIYSEMADAVVTASCKRHRVEVATQIDMQTAMTANGSGIVVTVQVGSHTTVKPSCCSSEGDVATQDDVFAVVAAGCRNRGVHVATQVDFHADGCPVALAFPILSPDGSNITAVEQAKVALKELC